MNFNHNAVHTSVYAARIFIQWNVSNVFLTWYLQPVCVCVCVCACGCVPVGVCLCVCSIFAGPGWFLSPVYDKALSSVFILFYFFIYVWLEYSHMLVISTGKHGMCFCKRPRSGWRGVRFLSVVTFSFRSFIWLWSVCLSQRYGVFVSSFPFFLCPIISVYHLNNAMDSQVGRRDQQAVVNKCIYCVSLFLLCSTSQLWTLFFSEHKSVFCSFTALRDICNDWRPVSSMFFSSRLAHIPVC